MVAHPAATGQDAGRHSSCFHRGDHLIVHQVHACQSAAQICRVDMVLRRRRIERRRRCRIFLSLTLPMPISEGRLERRCLPIQQRGFGIPITEGDRAGPHEHSRVLPIGNGVGFWVARSNDEVVGTVGIERHRPAAAALRQDDRRRSISRPRVGRGGNFSMHCWLTPAAMLAISLAHGEFWRRIGSRKDGFRLQQADCHGVADHGRRCEALGSCRIGVRRAIAAFRTR